MGWLEALVSTAHANLTESGQDRELEALWSRGVSDQQIAAFKIGHLNGLPPIQCSEDFVEWSRSGQKLMDVYVFPLTNALGQVKGVQFRHVEREVKGYTDYFVAKDEPILFGLSQAIPHIWATRKVCLVEGVFDLFPVQHVFPFALTTLTSTVSSNFLRFLKRNVRDVWFAYDMDAPGRKGVYEFMQHRSDFENIRAPQLQRLKFANGKRAKDPSDLWELMGDERFGVYLKSVFEQR